MIILFSQGFQGIFCSRGFQGKTKRKTPREKFFSIFQGFPHVAMQRVVFLPSVETEIGYSLSI